MRIGIYCTPEHGAFAPSFWLARQLLAAGHEPVFFGFKDFEATVRRQGLEYITLYRDQFGDGDVEIDPIPGNLLNYWRWMRNQFRRRLLRPGYLQIEREIADGTFPRLFQQHRLDLMLVDALCQGTLVPLLASAGLRVAVFYTELSGDDWNTPPSTSRVVPPRRRWARWLVSRVLWWWLAVVRGWHRLFWAVPGALYKRLIFVGLPLREAEKVSQAMRRRLRECEKQARLRRRFWEYSRCYDLNCCVLASRPFDYAWARPGAVYFGPAIDTARVEVDFPWEKIDSAKRLVYVSLGTHAASYRKIAVRFFRQVFQVAREAPEIQFVLSMGKGRSVEEIGPLPSNLVAASVVPQLAMLRRASCAITNGGLNTIKECIWFGVPMIVAPCQWDQAGNSARVIHHGIGFRTRARSVRAGALRSLIVRCLEDQGVRQRVLAMSRKFRDQVSSPEEIDRWLREVQAKQRGVFDAPEDDGSSGRGGTRTEHGGGRR